PRVWIDWSILKNAHTELLAWRQYESGESFTAEGLKVTPIPVTHTVLTHALLVEDKIRAVLIDLSFPAALTELGRVSKHHSVTTLLEEMEKINPAATVYGIHLKPMYRDQIMAEVEALDNPRLVIAEVGKEYNF